MMFDPLSDYSVSIIVIGYNIERYINRCIDSVFEQTYDNYEVIFVDDGSTDSTLEKVKQYKSTQPFLTVFQKNNGGIVSARKEGVKLAKGKYILFVDGDDTICPDMLSNLIASLKKIDDEYEIIISDYYEGAPDGTWIKKCNPYEYGIFHEDFFARTIMDGSLYHFMFAKLYNRSFILEAGYLDFPDITIAEDLFTNSVFGVLRPSVLYLNCAGYKYHYNETSVTRDGKLNIIDRQIDTINLMSEYIHQLSCNKYESYLEYQWYLFVFLYIQTHFSHKFKKYLVRECKEHLIGISKNELYKAQKHNLSVLYGRFLLFTCPYICLSY